MDKNIMVFTKVFSTTTDSSRANFLAKDEQFHRCALNLLTKDK